MAVKAACAKIQYNLDILFKLNQCLTTRGGSCQAFSISSSKSDKVGRPKRPPGPFFLYANAVKDNLRKEYPDVRYQEITRMCGKMWNNLEHDEKEKYNNDYARRKEAYEEQLQYYKETAPIEQKTLTKKEKKKMKKEKLSSLGKPKARRSALNFYTKAMCSGEHAVSFAEAAGRFNQLSPKEKEPYVKESELDKERYLREIEKWEQEMIEMGNGDVIPKRRKRRTRTTN